MNRLTVMAAVALLAFGSRADSAWDALQMGLKEYEAGNFANAATNFDAAGMAAAKEKFDPAVPAFNRANALLKSGKAQDAAHTFEEALRTTDLGLQSKAYHNRGNTMLGIAGGQEKEQKFDEAIKSVDEAMAMYERSMMLDAKDRDPKVNYELAGLKRQELEQKRKEQQQQQQQNKDQKKDDKNQKKDDQKSDQQDKNQNPQDQQQGQDQNKDEKKDGKQEPKDPQSQDEKSGEEQQQEQRERTEKMTPQEAAMLLDAMKQREQSQREKLVQMWLNRAKNGKQQPVDKDW